MPPNRSHQRCPHCDRDFDTVAAVVRHLNHPYNSCTNWVPPPHSQPNPPSGPVPAGPKDHSSVKFPFSGHIIGRGAGFMDCINSDKFSDFRTGNLYYPFASRDEWELAAFLTQSEISMRVIDDFLSLGLIRNLGFSFRTAKALRGLVELLPGGPKWVSQEVELPGYPTENPLILYYRDPVECVQWILRNPIYSNHLRYSPERRTTADGNREYGDWITSDGAWFMQSQLPRGSTLLGVTLSSDKTNISAMSGNRVAHPVLITLANLDSDVRTKSSYRAFQLLALLPVPKFLGVQNPYCGVLENRVTHACLDMVCRPLKVIARDGARMGDYFGDIRYCYTPLVGYITDTPEATALAGVSGKTSHLTTAFGPQFGDALPHPQRTADQMLTDLATLSASVNPWNLTTYVERARVQFRLNGVDRPFWRDWALPTGVLPDPCRLFPIEILHHFHKFFWDHDLRWCIQALGPAEIDFRFSLLQPRCGFRHFPSGISTLKQVTGREHRNIQRYILGVIAGAVPPEFIHAMRALLNLRYLAQMRRIDAAILENIASALGTFHHHKQIILDKGYRRGKRNNPINHFEIPKLELLHSVVPSIRWFGALFQWSSDRTEYSHIDFIKRPKKRTNGHDYSSQICRHLDRATKIQLFDLTTTLLESSAGDEDVSNTEDAAIFDEEGAAISDEEDGAISDGDDAAIEDAPVLPVTARRPVPDFFNARPPPSRPVSALHRTFVTDDSALRVRVKPHIPQISVDCAAMVYSIPNLQVSISDWFSNYLRSAATRTVSGRQGSVHEAEAPFKEIHIWKSIQVQNHDAVGGLRPPQRLFAEPPSDDWPFGRCDTALFRETVGEVPMLPGPGLNGQIRLIFHPIWEVETRLPLYLAYVHRFDIVPQPHAPRGQRSIPDPVTGMYVLKKATRSDGSPMGGIVPLYHCSVPVHLIPHFGKAADPHLTHQTSMERSKTFFLNHYFDTEDFYHLYHSV